VKNILAYVTMMGIKRLYAEKTQEKN